MGVEIGIRFTKLWEAGMAVYEKNRTEVHRIFLFDKTIVNREEGYYNEISQIL